jgi:AraC-like DNA-binding protein
MTASVYSAQALGSESGFMVETVGYHVNDLMFTDFKCSNTRFQRTQRHLRGENKDFLVLHAQLSGEELLQMEHGVIRFLPGNLYLRDWAYAFDSQVVDMHIRGVMIPRYRLRFSRLFNVHNPVLSWSMSEPDGALLWRVWSQLFDELSRVDRGTADVLTEGFLGFLNGIVMVDDRGHRPGHSKLHAMEQYLQTQLRGDVSVDNLCEHFHISRASLFRLLKSHGGLKHYIDRLRLERCYAELRSSDPQRVTIREVAAGWGYEDSSSFNRKFRKQFGLPPSTVLGAGYDGEKAVHEGQQVPSELQKPYRNFKRWLAYASGWDKPDG